MLDEPTNDLDIETLELLEEIIEQYQGTVLIVSHDREFIDNTCSAVWAFEGKGKVTEIVGGYSDCEAYLKQQAAIQKENEKPVQNETVVKAVAPKKANNKLSYKLKLELESLPSKVEALEVELETQQALVNDPEFFKQDAETTQAALNHLADLESKLETAFNRWEELEALQNQ